jgi:hypothetical protein
MLDFPQSGRKIGIFVEKNNCDSNSKDQNLAQNLLQTPFLVN